jgi:hypothetical protein
MVEAQTFLSPVQVTHKQYEALRAYYVDGLSGAGQTCRTNKLLDKRMQIDSAKLN